MKNGAAVALAATFGLCLLAFAGGPAALSLTSRADEEPSGEGPDEKESPAEPEEGPKEKVQEKAKPKLTVDELYVREHLEKHLHATAAEFFDNGYVRLTFDFLKKDLDQGKSFTPPVSQEINSPFRWTVGGEEKTSTFKDGTTLRTRGGLKIASKGIAFLNCWYQDDLTVSLDYLPSSNHDPRQMVALLFQNEKKKALGTNFGNQCAIYVNGQPKGEVRGKVPPIASLENLLIKLIVKRGKFDAQVGKTPRESMDYNPKEFTSGRIGILWGGPNVNGIVKKLEIAGRLDFPRVAKEIRAAPRK